MRLTDEQKEKLRTDLHAELGLYFYGNEINALIEIISRYESFSKKISKGSIDDTEFKAHGPDITEEEQKKMSGARKAVFDIMSDGQWRTLEEIRRMGIDAPTQSIAIYLRSFRENQYGAYTVNRKKRGKTRLFEYQVVAS